MKKIGLFFFCLFLTGITNYTTAQVTIGTDMEPIAGALLDLKEYTPAADNTNSSKGLAMPRIGLTDLYDITADIAGATTANQDKHIGLMVYNVNGCLIDTTGDYHGKGMYVWDGSQWQILNTPKEDFTQKLIDPRDNELYLYRNFGTEAGSWMLENLRYVPKPADGFDNYTHSFAQADNPGDQKYYCYPADGSYVIGTTPPDGWKPNQGLLYNWYAATNNENNADVDQGAAPQNNIQGICPDGWHLPSDYEWSLLEKEIYNNPAKYSPYTSSNQFSPTSWDDDWAKGNTTSDFPAGDGLRGSTNGMGHGKAMEAACPLPGSPNTDPLGLGNSPTSTQGGFNALLTGFNQNGQNSSYYYGAYFISSSHWRNSLAQYGFYYRGIEYITAETERAKVRRHHAANYLYFSVRCKKD